MLRIALALAIVPVLLFGCRMRQGAEDSATTGPGYTFRDLRQHTFGSSEDTGSFGVDVSPDAQWVCYVVQIPEGTRERKTPNLEIYVKRTDSKARIALRSTVDSDTGHRTRRDVNTVTFFFYEASAEDGDRLKWIFGYLCAVENGRPLVEQRGQAAHDTGLRLSPFAEQDDVLRSEQCVG